MIEALKVAIRNGVRNRGWDLVRTPNLIGFLKSRRVDLVLDVGANDGGYGSHLRRWGYTGRLLSFEPGADAFARLCARASGDPLWQALNIALGDRPGTAELNVSEFDVYSSLQPLSDYGEAFDRRTKVLRTETVKVETLDAACGRLPEHNLFLKIDTQGHEQKILEGGGHLLGRCCGVQLELPISHLYEGMWKFPAALGFMEEMGFVPAQISPVNCMSGDPASVVEFDVIFRRTN
jgi:FkbM family methyltransferase